jgi:ABC-type multidrug transport system fused ATPase/permease subunit
LAAIHDEIVHMPDGYDTHVTERGQNLSGGQRQRLALARALLADPPLMILDEPTAHLDPDSRRALTTDILTVTQGRATLLITHDLDGLDQVDEIIILDHGRVAARGTHAELLRTSGLYRQMWRRGRFGSSPSARAGSFESTGAGQSGHPDG